MYTLIKIWRRREEISLEIKTYRKNIKLGKMGRDTEYDGKLNGKREVNRKLDLHLNIFLGMQARIC